MTGGMRCAFPPYDLLRHRAEQSRANQIKRDGVVPGCHSNLADDPSDLSLRAGAGVAVEQAVGDARADEMPDIAAERADLLDEARRDELVAVGGHQKDGLDIRVQPGV